MAKKRKRTVTRRSSSDVDAVDDADEEGEWEEDTSEEAKQQTAAPKPATPQMMVTWNGEAGASKQWYGMVFEAGKPTPVGHSPFWDAMRKEIDAARSGAWSYEYVIETPEPEV